MVNMTEVVSYNFKYCKLTEVTAFHSTRKIGVNPPIMAETALKYRNMAVSDKDFTESIDNKVRMMENGHPVIDIVLPTYRMVPEENERYSEHSNRMIDVSS
jgi:hypothetical protein